MDTLSAQRRAYKFGKAKLKQQVAKVGSTSGSVENKMEGKLRVDIASPSESSIPVDQKKLTAASCSGAAETSAPDPISEATDCILSQEDAIAFARCNMNCPKIPENHLKIFVRTLGFHQYAIQLGTHYIRRELYDTPVLLKIFAYLELFHGADDRHPVQEGLSEVEKGIFKAFLLTMSAINSQNETDADLLISIMAFFEPGNIPLDIFAKMPMFSDSKKIKQDIMLLKKYSLISAPVSDAIKIDPLIQRFLRRTIAKTNVTYVLKLAIEALQQYLDPNYKSPDISISLIEHSICVWSHALQIEALVRMHANFPSYLCALLYSCKRNSELFQIARDTAPRVEHIFGPKFMGTILIKHYQAQALFSLEKYDEALEILNKINPIARSELGTESRMSAEISLLILETLGAQKNYSAQLDMFNEILAELEKGPEDNPNYWRMLKMKSYALGNLDMPREALIPIRKVIYLQEKYLGRNSESLTSTKYWFRVMIAEAKEKYFHQFQQD